MMFAQSVVEYGALASAKSNLQAVGYTIREWFAQAGPGTWIVIGGVVVLVFWMKRR
jgi:hypothetical protein